MALKPRAASFNGRTPPFEGGNLGSTPRAAATRPPTLAELEQGLTIDTNDVEGSAARQPDLYYRVAKQVALLTSQRDAAIQALKELEAIVDKEVRAHFASLEERATDKTVESERNSDSRVIAANARLLEIKKRLGLIVALEKAYDQRSYALNHISTMQFKNWASNNGEMPRRVKQALTERAEHAMRAGNFTRGE